jgi:hypothetical protein
MPKRQNQTGNDNGEENGNGAGEETGSAATLSSLVSDVANLRADMSSVTEALRSLGEGATTRAGELWRSANESMKPSVDTLQRTVQSNPVLSLLAAVGVGMILARMFSSGRSRDY